MICYVEVIIESFLIVGSFIIFCGLKILVDVVVCIICEGGNVGRGECVLYCCYGEMIEIVMVEINVILFMVVEGMECSVL